MTRTRMMIIMMMMMIIIIIIIIIITVVKRRKDFKIRFGQSSPYKGYVHLHKI